MLVKVSAREYSSYKKVPTNEDGSLSISELRKHFPSCVGIRYRSRPNNYLRGTLVNGDQLLLPAGERWEDYVFHCVMEDVQKHIEREPSPSVPLDLETFEMVALGLPNNIKDADFYRYFSKFGKLKHCDLKKTSRKSIVKAYGFLQYEQYGDQNKCMLTNHFINGVNIALRLPTAKMNSESCRRQLFITNITPSVGLEDILHYFSTFGKITQIFMPPVETRHAFLTFDSEECVGRVLSVGESHRVFGGYVIVEQVYTKREILEMTARTSGGNPERTVEIVGNQTEKVSLSDKMSRENEKFVVHGEEIEQLIDECRYSEQFHQQQTDLFEQQCDDQSPHDEQQLDDDQDKQAVEIGQSNLSNQQCSGQNVGQLQLANPDEKRGGDLYEQQQREQYEKQQREHYELQQRQLYEEYQRELEFIEMEQFEQQQREQYELPQRQLYEHQRELEFQEREQFEHREREEFDFRQRNQFKQHQRDQFGAQQRNQFGEQYVLQRKREVQQSEQFELQMRQPYGQDSPNHYGLPNAVMQQPYRYGEPRRSANPAPYYYSYDQSALVFKTANSEIIGSNDGNNCTFVADKPHWGPNPPVLHNPNFMGSNILSFESHSAAPGSSGQLDSARPFPAANDSKVPIPSQIISEIATSILEKVSAQKEDVLVQMLVDQIACRKRRVESPAPIQTESSPSKMTRAMQLLQNPQVLDSLIRLSDNLDFGSHARSTNHPSDYQDYV